MKISILTAFPDMIKSYLGTSILGRGITKGKLTVEVIDIRAFSDGKYKQIDDYCYGKGGMILMPEPLKKAIDSISKETTPYVVYPSPQGVVLHQELVEDLSKKENIVILCGHYEGVDERFTQKYVDLEVSIGDFVLTGGELPALALVDAISRLVPGVVGKVEAVEEDSFYSGMLDHPNYTRPSNWDGESVPEILLSGNDKIIKDWRRRQSAIRTLKRRPDIVSRAGIMPYLTHGSYIVEIIDSFIERQDEDNFIQCMKMHIKDVAKSSASYGIKRYILISPDKREREIIKSIISELVEESEANNATSATGVFTKIKLMGSTDRAFDWINKREGCELYKIVITTKDHKRAENWLSIKRDILLKDHCSIFIFGKNSELYEQAVESATAVLTPISQKMNQPANISLRSSVSITLDRFFGRR